MKTISQERMLIVGGRGRMGTLFTQLFSRHSFQVEVLEQGEAYNTNRISSFDYVLLAVPMSVAEKTAETIAPLVRNDALLFDINSLKERICTTMSTGCAGEVVGLHPMFGPTVRSLHQQTIVVCPERRGERAKRILSVLQEEGAKLVEISATDHDKMMARVQALTHFTKIALGETWRRSGISIEENLRVVSPVYLLELSIVGRIFAQDPALYGEIEMANPYAPEERKRFLNAAHDLATIIDRGDRAQFAEYFTEVSRYLSQFSEQAMSLSDVLVAQVARKVSRE